MANIIDYLAWRGDIPFSFDGFTLVDNLILSELAYAELENVIIADGVALLCPLRELSLRCHTAQTRGRKASRNSLHDVAVDLLCRMAETNRFRNILLTGYENHINTEKTAQMAVASFLLDRHTAYIAFRGTDDSIAGWKEDFSLSYLRETPGQRLAVEYLNRHYRNTDLTLRIGGHSKGGNFAVYAAAFCDVTIQQRIETVYTNDGPGFRDEILATDAYQRIAPRITSILPQDSIVGMLLTSTSPAHIVKSSAAGLMQHDAMTWQIVGNHFEEVSARSSTSDYFDRVLRQWIGAIPDEERAFFTETLFSFLFCTGAETLDEIRTHRQSSMRKMLRFFGTMPKEEKQQFQKILQQLIKHSAQTAVDDLTHRSPVP